MSDQNIWESLDLQNFADDDTEFIPLLTNEDEEDMNNEDTPVELPILAIRWFCPSPWAGTRA